MVFFPLLVPILFAVDKGPPSGEGSNRDARLHATAYLDKAAIKQAVGGELSEGILVIHVKLTPIRKLAIHLDDFLLRSDRDGQKSTPYTPSQVAGSSVLVLKTGVAGGGTMAQDRGPVWGGLGGGMPGRMPGNGGGIGSSPGVETVTGATAEGDDPSKKKEDPVLAILKQKVLAEAEATEPVSGQLYFLMDGKHKVKDLELLYKTSAGRISIRFK